MHPPCGLQHHCRAARPLQPRLCRVPPPARLDGGSGRTRRRERAPRDVPAPVRLHRRCCLVSLQPSLGLAAAPGALQRDRCPSLLRQSLGGGQHPPRRLQRDGRAACLPQLLLRCMAPPACLDGGGRGGLARHRPPHEPAARVSLQRHHGGPLLLVLAPHCVPAPRRLQPRRSCRQHCQAPPQRDTPGVCLYKRRRPVAREQALSLAAAPCVLQRRGRRLPLLQPHACLFAPCGSLQRHRRLPRIVVAAALRAPPPAGLNAGRSPARFHERCARPVPAPVRLHPGRRPVPRQLLRRLPAPPRALQPERRLPLLRQCPRRRKHAPPGLQRNRRGARLP
jgi:hypothetical protein